MFKNRFITITVHYKGFGTYFNRALMKIVFWIIVGVSDIKRGAENVQTHRQQLNGSKKMFKNRSRSLTVYYKGFSTNFNRVL